MIAAQKELAAQGRQEETRNHAQHRPRRNSARSQERSPATVSFPRCSRPANSPAKAPCNAIQDEVGAKLVEKFGAEKVTRIRHQGRVLLHPEGSRPQLDSGTAASASTVARLTPSVRSPAKSAFCRAPTARRFSPAAKRRPSRSPRSAPATTRRNLIPTPAARPRRNSSCITTSRISPSAKPAASAARAVAKSATARWPNAPSNPMLPKDYPYAVRVTSEIMESNGSTSMASVCGGTLALMDAGVPMIRPVAGISVGICTEHDERRQDLATTNCSPTSSAGKTRSATWIAKSPARKRASPASNST